MAMVTVKVNGGPVRINTDHITKIKVHSDGSSAVTFVNGQTLLLWQDEYKKLPAQQG